MSEYAYFDNAATTFPKPDVVYSFADEMYRTIGGSVGRGDHPLSRSASSLVKESKETLSRLFRCEGRVIVYTASATDALNRILLGLELSDAAVYVSPFEHNAVTRVLHHLKASANTSIQLLPFDPDTLLLDEARLTAAFDATPPNAVVVTHASNVCGAILPVEQICRIAHERGAITIIDMSQTAGLLPLSLNDEAIDFAVFAGHKTLLAPFGIGGFVCSPSEHRLKPVLFGGNGINSLEQTMPTDIVAKEEIGSQNLYAIAGLLASARWLIEQDDVYEIERSITESLLTLLRSYPNIDVVADSMRCERTGVVSCLFDGYTPDEIGSVLSDLGIAVRTGLHCAPYAHDFLHTLPLGTVRLSVSPLTSEDDMALLKDALDYVQENG